MKLFVVLFKGAGYRAQSVIIKGEKEIPQIEGAYVFFGSRSLWMFLFTLSVTIAVLLPFLGTILSLFIGLAAASVFYLLLHYFFER